MKKIQLTQDKYTIVDDGDFEWLNQFKWYALKSKNTFYARRLSKSKKRVAILMHREILGLKYGDGKQTDHIDGNGLNNQRFNLRTCSHQQNGFNRKPQKNVSSRFKGVYRIGDAQKWRSHIMHNGKEIHLGLFLNEIDAAKAYDKKALELFGEFANINFKQEAINGSTK